MQRKHDSNRQSAIRWFHHCMTAPLSLHRNQLSMIHRLIYGSNVIVADARYKMDEKATKTQKCTALKEEQVSSNLKAITCRHGGRKKCDGWGKKGCIQDFGENKSYGENIFLQ